MAQRRCIERITGADQEVASFITGTNALGGTDYEASRRILAEVDGIPSSYVPSYSPAWGAATGHHSYGGASATPIGYYSQDHGRKYLLTNGGCIYIDLNHPEICIPEVTSAHDHVASTHAMLRVLRVAVERANRRLPDGQDLEVLVNNSDGLSHSYGSHLNVLVSRATWDAIFSHKLHYLLFLASPQVSSIIYTGLGKIGAENERPWVDYQISQRADFFETLHGEQTTHRRPLVNSRDEALCGETLPRYTSGNGRSNDEARRSGDGLARLHCIFYDANLAQVAMLLKVGVLQIIVTMIEAGVVDSRLILEDPLSAVHAWSRDLSFQTRCNRISGRSVTAIDLQRRFLEAAERFAGGGGLDGIVPRSSEILALWADTLDKLAARDMDALARRLDWVLKLQTLERARRDHGFEWQSRELRYLDRLYSSLDETRGLYWNYERQGLIDRVVGDDRIEQLRREPPEDTRAWGRTMLLRSSEAGAEIHRVDWDSVTLDLPDRARNGRGGRRVTVSLDDPRRWGKSDLAAVFDDGTPFGAMLGASEAIGDSSEPDVPAINGSSRGA
jgi:proteasome accessory factor A